MSVLTAQGLKKICGSRCRVVTRALDNFSLDVSQGGVRRRHGTIGERQDHSA